MTATDTPAARGLRTTVTDLEAFRLFRTEEWMGYDDLMKRVTRADQQTVMMAAGEAFHGALQRVGCGNHPELRYGRFVFDLSKVNAEIALAPLREMRLSKRYVIDGVTLDVRGRSDGDDGVVLDEHKIRYGTFDAETYAESYQWRIYLDIGGHQAVRYNVFQGPGSDSAEMRSLEQAWQLCPCLDYVERHEPDCGGVNGTCGCTILACAACGVDGMMHGTITMQLLAYHSLTLYTYPDLRSDVLGLLHDYVAFARTYLSDEAILAWRETQDRLHDHINPHK